METGWVPSEEYVFPRADPESARGKATAFVTAMKGCDNVCSFCVVPHTRGREVSRPYAEIAREVASLVEVGVREITLIGQNVNSYAGGCSFAQLIRRVAAVPGVRRIRFTTSHPMDLSPELVDCFRDVPQLMPHFHLPVQHGADTVLERMRRRYTIAEYEERVARLFAACPGVALTSDIICGFPGETEEEHALTLALLRRVPYDNLFSFVFSERPHTAAALRLSKERAARERSPQWLEIPRAVATRRLEEVQRLQQARTVARHRSRAGGFYDAPFPSAELQKDDGHVDVLHFPNPAHVAIIDQALTLIGRDANGFALTSGVFFSLTGAAPAAHAARGGERVSGCSRSLPWWDVPTWANRRCSTASWAGGSPSWRTRRE